MILVASLLTACGGGARSEPATGSGTGPSSALGASTTSSGGERASNQNGPSGPTVVASDPQLHAGPATGAARAAQGPAVALEGLGMDREHPVPACGPRDSYDYVASRFRCPDGTNPLGGDMGAGQASRLGNVGANSQGHIIDVYRVPCASGPVDVYVDMYGCPEMQGMLGR
jgi:hypothetical protein